MLAEDVQRGLLPDDGGYLCGLLRDVCFADAKRYFAFAGTIAQGIGA
jgi:hypothetical protein